MGAGTSDVGIDVDKVQAQLPRVGSAADEAEEARSAMETAAYDQTESRWGVESGPKDFRERYSKALWDTHDKLQKIQENLAGFRPLLSKAAQAIQEADTGSALDFTIVATTTEAALSSHLQSTSSTSSSNSAPAGSPYGAPSSPSAG